MSSGRNFDEVLRLLDSLQLTARHKVGTPVNWRHGDDVIIVPSVSDEEARVRFPQGWKAPKPYLRIVPSRPRRAAMASDALRDFVRALRDARTGAADAPTMLRRVRGIAMGLARRRGEWLRESMGRPDPDQGFGLHLLHEEADPSLATFVVSWLPGRGTPPHDHGTWAVVVGLDGEERNTLWRRLDDGSRRGYAELEPVTERTVGADDVIAMPTGVIHSVRNPTDAVTLSLHVYGMHVNHTERSGFDPQARTESIYKVKVSA